MRKLLLILIFAAVLFLLTGCSESTPIWEDWEVFDFTFEPFPDAIVFVTEYEVYSLNALNSGTMISANLYSAEYHIRFGEAFAIVKQAGDGWRIVPVDGLGFLDVGITIPPSVYWAFWVTNEHFDLSTATNALYTDGMLVPGTYRIVLMDKVSICRDGIFFGWQFQDVRAWHGLVWAEFTIYE